jgi:acyl-CoA synthetase (AMP-forming)/AMP-acid ligase II
MHSPATGRILADLILRRATELIDVRQFDETGDLGYRDARGLFYITGRKSRFVKLYGWRVSLDEVEDLLSDAAPVAAVNERERLVIYTERPGLLFAAAVERLAAKLKLHPSGFEIREIESIPRLVNGKVDYRSLTDAIGPAAGRPAPSR